MLKQQIGVVSRNVSHRTYPPRLNNKFYLTIVFKSLSEGVFDTSSPMGEAIFQIIAVLKSMEVNVLRERTMKGLEAARARGISGGRPAGSYNKEKASAAVVLYKQKSSIDSIEDALDISRSTIYRYLRNEGVQVNGFTKSK